MPEQACYHNPCEDDCEAQILVPTNINRSRDVVEIEDYISRNSYNGIASEDYDGFWY